jgi:hypothetical protein
MFLRFVGGPDAEDPHCLTGVFVAAQRLRDEGRLYDYEVALLNETYAWFNENLPCPPFVRFLGSGEWTPGAVAWFRDGAGEPLRRIWDLVHILRENGVPVRLVTTDRPGRIVYVDKYQIVAETPTGPDA